MKNNELTDRTPHIRQLSILFKRNKVSIAKQKILNTTGEMKVDYVNSNTVFFDKIIVL